MKKKNQIIAIFGRKGSGKSTLLEYAVRNSRRLLVIDPMGEHDIGLVTFDNQIVYDNVSSMSQFRIVYRPIGVEDVDWAARLAYALGNMTFVIDEVDLYTNSAYLSEGIREIVHRGRHRDISLLIVSRQPNRIRPDITAQADHIYSFQAQGKHVISYLNDFTDDDDNMLKVRQLAPHYFVVIRGKYSLDILAELP